jgi:hypothetical protein
MADDLIIRPASRAEYQTAVDWAAAEGWNPGLDDLAAFFAADPEGFLMGWRNGAPVASISVVRYGPDYGFLGFYIVRPDQRGTGAGIAIWNAGMAHLGNRIIGLDGVPDQQENYKKSGFVLADETVRYSGIPRLSEASGDDIRDLGPDMLNALTGYDARFYPGPRAAFIHAWTLPSAETRRHTKVALNSGEIVGYGAIRQCREGYKIGPLFAETEATADALVKALCNDIPPAAPIAIDAPARNQAATALVARLGLKPSFGAPRMYKGPEPALPTQETFGITTMELG